MSLDPVAAATSNANTQAASINQQDFLQILLTQLTAQDPLKPMDNTQFVAQLAQFSQLEQTQEISASVTNAIAIQTSTQTVGLLGKYVSVTPSGSSAATIGQVTAIDYSGSAPLLTIQPVNSSGASSGAVQTGIPLSEVTGVQQSS